MRTSYLIVVALSAGCLRSTQFNCDIDAQCGTGGRCEAAHFCSFADGECGSGRRFGDASGSLSNTCVGDDGGVDAGVDAPTDPDATDAPEDKCSGYAALAGTPATQKYKLVATASSWDNAQNLCVADHPGSSYLAIPDDATELMALGTLTVAKYWIGVNDKANEGTFVNVKGAAAFTAFDTANGEPNDQGNQDCAAVLNNLMSTEKCGPAQPAFICECDDQ